MSRLLIKNLPANASPDLLRTHLSSVKHLSPVITDAHVARKADGTPRRFAFVGFKNEEQAASIKEYFDKTYWGSQKIIVQVVQGVKGAPAPRPNKWPRLENPSFISPAAPPSKAEDTAVAQPADEAVSDMDWLKSRMHHGLQEAGMKAFEQSDDEDERLDGQKKPSENDSSAMAADAHLDTQESTKRTILSTRRLFVRNLTFSCTSDELRELFGKYGAIEQIHIPTKADHTSKGLAFVLFASPDHAVSAWEALDGTTFQGRLLHILAGVERRIGYTNANSSKNLKEEHAEKRNRNKDSGKDFNWGMLYMNSDAVASSIAERLNIPKADLLGASGDDGTGSQNPAVKLALAETHIIQETRRYFESQGVVLETFARQSVPRSRNVMLVKNIPYGTTNDTLKEIFDPHGMISRLLMPPSGTLALVEYEHPEEAAHAFRAVAYKRLGSSIIYLEWAPEGLLSESTLKTTTLSESKPVTIREQELGVDVEQVSVRSGNTLFVKNLSFKTTSERLAEVFQKLPAFLFARVQMKPALSNQKGTQEKLSMGYGFVGFADKESAQKALTSMQGFVLDGHKLYVSFAGRGADEEERKEAGVAKAQTSKMIVKNVPFEATKKDIRDLFGVYGTLKSVRLPKKFDKRSRGFAFLEFVSRQEAENAYTALRHTHLLGRHLVLDWAAEGGQDAEELRRKVGIGFGGGNEMPGRKRKLEMALDVEDVEEEN